MLIPLTFLGMLIVERIAPARIFPRRRGWTLLGIGFLLLAGAVSSLLPLALDAEWLARHRLIGGTRLGVLGGAVVGYLVFSGISYGWHRLMHTLPTLWRGVHQLHHSPQRVDMPGSVLFHPFELLAQVSIQLFVTLLVLGLEPLAAALTGYVAAFYGMFQHWNIHTPRWLGYVIQRPESHCEHHRLGVHAHNYADLPLWDVLFGTFLNPASFEGHCGFESPGDRRVGPMLALIDVNEPAYGKHSVGARGGATACDSFQ